MAFELVSLLLLGDAELWHCVIGSPADKSICLYGCMIQRIYAKMVRKSSRVQFYDDVQDSYRLGMKKKSRFPYGDISLIVLLVLLTFFLRWESRFQTVWEWDEAQFALGVRDFDVSLHHPHPPGYPYLIGLGKVVHLFGFSEDKALILLSLVFGALTSVPLFLLFKRAADRHIAFFATLLFQFCPIVWFSGLRALSEPVSLFWFFMGMLFFYPFKTSFSSHQIWGSIFLGIAIGIRPQLLLIVVVFFVVVFLLLVQARKWGLLLFITATFLFINSIWIGVVCFNLGSFENFTEIYSQQATFLLDNDSMFSPHPEESFAEIGERLFHFFIDIWSIELIGWVIVLFSLIGVFAVILRRNRREFLVLTVCFVPALLFTIICCRPDILRYMVPFIPMICFYSLLGYDYLLRSIIKNDVLLTLLLFIMIGLYGRDTHLNLSELRDHSSPPQNALEVLTGRILGSSKATILLADGLYRPFLKYSLQPDNTETIIVDWDEPYTRSFLKQHRVYYFGDCNDDISMKKIASSEYRSEFLHKLSQSRFMKTSLIQSPILLLDGWFRYGYDYKLRLIGRHMSPQGFCIFYGRLAQNILEIEGSLRGNWEELPQLSITFENGLQYVLPIREKHFTIRTRVPGKKLPRKIGFGVHLEVQIQGKVIEGENTPLFITSIRWN